MKQFACAFIFMLFSYPCLAQSAGCGIAKSLDTYDQSPQTWQDAIAPMKAILLNEDGEDPKYSACVIPELKRADSFFTDVVELILHNGKSVQSQSDAIAVIHSSQKLIRVEIARQNAL